MNAKLVLALVVVEMVKVSGLLKLSLRSTNEFPLTVRVLSAKNVVGS